MCDENFIPYGSPETLHLEANEEEYHKDKRVSALEKGHYISKESTNPEWDS